MPKVKQRQTGKQTTAMYLMLRTGKENRAIHIGPKQNETTLQVIREIEQSRYARENKLRVIHKRKSGYWLIRSAEGLF